MPKFYPSTVNFSFLKNNLPKEMSVKSWVCCSEKLRSANIPDVLLRYYGPDCSGEINMQRAKRIRCLVYEKYIPVGYQLWLYYMNNPDALPLNFISVLNSRDFIVFDGTVLDYETNNYVSDEDENFIRYAVLPAIFKSQKGEIVFGYLKSEGENKYCVRAINFASEFRHVVKNKIYTVGHRIGY